MSHRNESCRTGMSHVIYKRMILHTNESCRTRMSHVAHEGKMSRMNESCHINTESCALKMRQKIAVYVGS